MADFLEFLSSNELTIVVVLMIAIFVLIMTIIIIDIVSRKNSKEIKTFEEDALEDTKIKIETPNNGLGMIADEAALRDINIEKVGKLDKTAEIEEIKYVEEDEELEKTKALLELETLKKELAKMEQEKNQVQVPAKEEEPVVEKTNDKVVELPKEEKKELVVESIEENKSTEPLKTMEDEVNTFEQEQEENAIISVEELTKASQNITDEEIEQYEDDGNEPISIKELEAMYKSIDEPKQEEIPKKTEKEERLTMPDFKVKVRPAVDVYDDKEFKNTPVISPVYGLKPTESSISLEQTANLDKLNEEIRKTNEFLSALKELRKNLE